MMNLRDLSDAELEVIFRTWWSESYSAAPPGSHALITHLGWARFLLNQPEPPAT